MMANEFLKCYGNNAANVMSALDAAEIPADQDWDNGTTTWTLGDGSKIVVDGSEVSAQ